MRAGWIECFCESEMDSVSQAVAAKMHVACHPALWRQHRGLADHRANVSLVSVEEDPNRGSPGASRRAKYADSHLYGIERFPPARRRGLSPGASFSFHV